MENRLFVVTILTEPAHTLQVRRFVTMAGNFDAAIQGVADFHISSPVRAAWAEEADLAVPIEDLPTSPGDAIAILIAEARSRGVRVIEVSEPYFPPPSVGGEAEALLAAD